MGCALTTGRKIPCKSAFGGIKAVYFAEYGTIQSITLDNTTKEGTIVDATPAPVYYKYDLKGTSSLETTITSSRDNGTTFYTQTVNLTLTYLDAKTQAEIQLLAANRPYVIVEDYYGNEFLCGLENGMELTTGTTVTGSAAGDLSGFTLTFEGIEETAPIFLAASQISADNAQIDPTPAS